MNRVEQAVELVRGMLSVAGADDPFAYIEQHQRAFIWDDDTDYVERWNALAGAGAGLEDVAQHFEENGQPFLGYKGRTVKVPILFERGDGTICVYTLARLVAADSEIRMCADTSGNSEYAYFPLPPARWLELEAAFGRDAVDARFLRLPDTLDGFYRAIEAALGGGGLPVEDGGRAPAPRAPPPVAAEPVARWEPLIRDLVVRALGALCFMLGDIVAWATADGLRASPGTAGYFVFAPVLAGLGLGYLVLGLRAPRLLGNPLRPSWRLCATVAVLVVLGLASRPAVGRLVQALSRQLG